MLLSEILTQLNIPNALSSDIEIKGVCSLENSKKNHICFFSGKSPSALEKTLSTIRASAILIPENIDVVSKHDNIHLIKSQYPQKDFIKIIHLFDIKKQNKNSIHAQSVVSSSARVGQNVHIGPFSVIGDHCVIGDNCYIHPHVTMYDGVILGDNCIVHSGAILREYVEIGKNVIIQNGAIVGADGFGYIPTPNGLQAVPQIGNVILEDHVEIGANTCIDRAAIDTTKIGLGSKIDNLVQIGHNTQVGSHTIICGQAAIAGSTKIGNQVVIGGSVGIADHTEIADGCRFAGLSGLHGTYSEKGDYAGNPAMPARTYRKVVGITPKLPDLVKKLKLLSE
ncbi:MAG: UDP-3-O-(3-hydroxymyristoyl)glucosamine N-acyltransferase [Ignavibacteria bacterium]|nr:UDP-3-O-(3-hydroxymyristoyl)glucosamine N-acyltransferase [Ignavibacteria bacterium]